LVTVLAFLWLRLDILSFFLEQKGTKGAVEGVLTARETFADSEVDNIMIFESSVSNDK